MPIRPPRLGHTLEGGGADLANYQGRGHLDLVSKTSNHPRSLILISEWPFMCGSNTVIITNRG